MPWDLGIIGAATFDRLARLHVLDAVGFGPGRHRMAWRTDADGAGLVLATPSGLHWLGPDLSEERFVDYPANAVAAFPDGTTVSVHHDGHVRRWGPDGVARSVPGHPSGILDLAPDRAGDDQRVALLDTSFNVRVIDIGGTTATPPARRIEHGDVFLLSGEGLVIGHDSGAWVDRLDGSDPWVWDEDAPGYLHTKWPVVGLARSGELVHVAVNVPKVPGGAASSWGTWVSQQRAHVIAWKHLGAQAEVTLVLQEGESMTCLAANPLHRALAVGTDRATHVVDESDGRVLATIGHPAGDSPRELAYSPNGEQLAIRGRSGVQLWGRWPQRVVAERALGGEAPTCAAFSQDGTLLAVGDAHRRVVLWSTDRPRPLRGFEDQLVRDEPILQVTFAGDDRLVAAVSEDRVGVWWAETGEMALQVAGARDEPKAIAAHPVEPLLAVAGPGGTRIHDLLSGTVVAKVPDLRAETDDTIAFSPDGSRLAGPMDPDTVGLWSTGGWELQHVFHTWSEAVAFSPGGLLLAALDDEGTPRLWWTADGSPGPDLARRATSIGSNTPAPRLLFSPDGSLVLAGAGLVWRIGDGTLLERPDLPEVIAISADGSMAAARDGTQQVALWGVPAG